MKTGSDRDWIVPVVALVSVQYITAAAMGFVSGFIRHAPIFESLMIASPFMVAAILYLIFAARLPLNAAFENRLSSIRTVVIGGVLLALQFSLLTWMKMLLPHWSGGFWADPPLARLDYYLFGADPWRHARLLGNETIVAAAYAAWLFVVPIALALIILSRPSRAKAVALISAFGIIALCAFSQFLLPSAGPLFFDLAGWGNRFAGIEGPAASAREWLWRFHTDGVVKAGIGISAMPSMHVALALWLVLVARPYHWTLVALATGYFVLIFFGSVYLGLHYVTDGIAGAFAALLAWWAAEIVQAVGCRPVLPLRSVR